MKTLSRKHKMATAGISWDENGHPTSLKYGDIYFASDKGVDESNYVFFELNNLPARWSNTQNFCIGELGFGTGLNFLLALKHFRNSKAAGNLNFISYESEPLKSEDLTRALERWPELAEPAEFLINRYPLLSPGFHRIQFPEYRTNLTLCLGDANELLPATEARVDAWFLDGFAPDKNPELWNDAIFTELARLSNTGATCGTFTAAGAVRRGLESSGFKVEKVPGFAGKRESIKAIFAGHTARNKSKKVWLETPESFFNSTTPKSAIIIGAGIAGASCAHALSQRGIKCTLIDKKETIAAEASGNPQGLLQPYPAAARSPLARTLESGFLFSKALVEFLKPNYSDLSNEPHPGIQIPSKERLQGIINDKDLDIIDEFWKTICGSAISELSGLKLNGPVFCYPKACIVSPAKVCQALIDSAATPIEFCGSFEVSDFIYSEGLWTVKAENSATNKTAECLIIANSAEARNFKNCHWLGLSKIRGELAIVPATGESRKLKSSISADGYIIPEKNGTHVIGASYDRDDESLDTRLSTQEKLIADIDRWIPGLNLKPDAQLSGRVSFRATTRDKLPFVGAVPDEDFFAAEFSTPDLRSRKELPAAKHIPSLYLSTGFGSRGFSLAPLAAEIIAGLICGEPLPLEQDLIKALNPARSLLQHYKKAAAN